MNQGEQLSGQRVCDIVMAKMGHPQQVQEPGSGQSTYPALRNDDDPIIRINCVKVSRRGQLREGFIIFQVVIIEFNFVEPLARIADNRDFARG